MRISTFLLFTGLISIVLSFEHFVTRKGSQLYVNNVPYRFAGSNMYWLGLDENVGGVDYPTQFRVDDAFQTAAEMGATVVRAHTLGVSTGNSKSFETSLNNFNPTALQYIDYAVYSASKNNIRLIVPLTDNYHYYHGGKHDFTDWRNISDENQFYTDTTVISDFKNYINKLLTHTNNYTGLRYCDDPTVFAWETGNEIKPPESWTKTIADYIKSIDSKHLVLDGTYGINQNALNFTSVDLYSDHYYPMDVNRLTSDANLVDSHQKAFMAGEYGWDASNLPQFLSAIESSPVSVDTFWSLFPHLDTYGFEQHNDGFTLHYPGDGSTNASYVKDLRAHAYKMLGQNVPPSKTPVAPKITSLANGKIAWRGASAANVYSVEKSSSSTGPWTVICDKCANDNQTPWSSSSITSGSYYQVRGYNLDGVAGPYSPVQQLSFESFEMEKEITMPLQHTWLPVRRPS